jgi:hypothetical protein
MLFFYSKLLIQLYWITYYVGSLISKDLVLILQIYRVYEKKG